MEIADQVKEYSYADCCWIPCRGYGGNVPPGQPHPQKQRKNKKGTYLEQVERKEVKNYEKFYI